MTSPELIQVLCVSWLKASTREERRARRDLLDSLRRPGRLSGWMRSTSSRS